MLKFCAWNITWRYVESLIEEKIFMTGVQNVLPTNLMDQLNHFHHCALMRLYVWSKQFWANDFCVAGPFSMTDKENRYKSLLILPSYSRKMFLQTQILKLD